MNNPNEELKKAKTDLAKAEHEIASAEEALKHANEDLRHAEHEIEESEQRRPIHFQVDAEEETTEHHHLTPDQIIKDFGKKDPGTNYLVRIEHSKNVESYQGKGATEIKMRNGMCFQLISTGPTPVSDGRPATGTSAFLNGLSEMGFGATPLVEHPDHVVFDYTVPTGKFAGTAVRLGFIVPADFPLALPTGPHVSPQVLPINPEQAAHPSGGIHTQHSVNFLKAGGEWEYWSRPYPGRATSNKPVEEYMRHIWQLWDTQ